MSNSCPVCCSELDHSSKTCPFCGFKIHGSTEKFKPVVVENNNSNSTLESNSCGVPVFRVLRGSGSNVVIKISGDNLNIGRDPHCDIFLNDMTVSRNHARILKTPTGYEINDNSSYNGLWINNVSVDRKVLEPGDIIQIGVFTLKFDYK